MPDISREHVMEDHHIASMGNHIWQETFAFVPTKYSDNGSPIFADSIATAYVRYESARIQWPAGEGSDFARENPDHGKMTAVVDGISIYEKTINEKLPLLGLRAGIRRRKAIKRVCKLFELDPKSHLDQPEYQSLKDHLSD